jgi:gluconolactonase
MSGTFVVHDPDLAEALGPEPRLELVVRMDAHEGPVYAADEDALYFTSADGAVRRLALDGERFPPAPERLSTVLGPRAANGMTMDREGRLVICEQGSLGAPARVSRLDRRDRRVETVVDGWGGAPLNSPNDVIVASDGAVWFTDPSYGHLQGFRPPPRLGDHVYRHDPLTGRTRVVADGFDKPNGLVLSPDERTLYVGDSGANQEPGSFHVGRPHRIVAFDVRDGHLSGARLITVTTPGFPDGLAVDEEGRLYASSSSGVQVFGPAGDELGEIRLPGAVNFAFGGPGRNVLFITADSAIWAATLATRGASRPEPALHHARGR